MALTVLPHFLRVHQTKKARNDLTLKGSVGITIMQM